MATTEKKKTDWSKVFAWLVIILTAGKYAFEQAKEKGLIKDSASQENEN